MCVWKVQTWILHLMLPSIMEQPTLWKPLTEHFPKRYTKSGLNAHRNRQGYQPLLKTTDNHRNETTIMLQVHIPPRRRWEQMQLTLYHREMSQDGHSLCSPRQHRDLPSTAVFHHQKHYALHYHGRNFVECFATPCWQLIWAGLGVMKWCCVHHMVAGLHMPDGAGWRGSSTVQWSQQSKWGGKPKPTK